MDSHGIEDKPPGGLEKAKDHYAINVDVITKAKVAKKDGPNMASVEKSFTPQAPDQYYGRMVRGGAPAAAPSIWLGARARIGLHLSVGPAGTESPDSVTLVQIP